MTKKVENLNLYSVRVGDRVFSSHIEAASDDEAIALAAKNGPASDGKFEIVSKEPVYEETIGLDCSDGESESDVFEIRVKGVSEKKVAELARAIYTFIGGPGMSEADYEKIHSARPLAEATDGIMAFI